MSQATLMKGETKAAKISKRPDRCGGDACIRETRIPVWVLVNFRRLGGSDSNLLRDYPSLTPADLVAAWAYSATHAEEIERAIRENEEGSRPVSQWARTCSMSTVRFPLFNPL